MGLFKDCGCGCNGKRQEKQMLISLMSAALFYVVANPQTFLFMKGLTGLDLANMSGCPTGMGLLLHALVFFLVTWGLMNV
jgi:hypothetical protein